MGPETVTRGEDCLFPELSDCLLMYRFPKHQIHSSAHVESPGPNEFHFKSRTTASATWWETFSPPALRRASELLSGIFSSARRFLPQEIPPDPMNAVHSASPWLGIEWTGCSWSAGPIC